jgi:hypothetical protein
MHYACASPEPSAASGSQLQGCTSRPSSSFSSTMYALGSDHLNHVLSKGQIQWLLSIKDEHDMLIALRVEKSKHIQKEGKGSETDKDKRVDDEHQEANRGIIFSSEDAASSVPGNIDHPVHHHHHPCKRFKPSPEKPHQRFSIRSVCKVPWR